MHSFLTGKNETRNPDTGRNPGVDNPWTADDYLTAARRQLDLAALNSGAVAANRIAAAHALAKAAEVAQAAPPKTVRRDGDAL